MVDFDQKCENREGHNYKLGLANREDTVGVIFCTLCGETKKIKMHEED